MRTPLKLSAAVAAAALALTTLTACGGSSAAGPDDKNGKIKIMVGGLDKVIYLPASSPSSSAISRTKASTSSC